jgi:desulfoferrodoxin-like iron-binding protein
MTEINQNYKCNVCGNLVKIFQAGQGTLICCGQPMELIVEATVAQPVMEPATPMPEEIQATEETNIPQPTVESKPEENPSL